MDRTQKLVERVLKNVRRMRAASGVVPTTLTVDRAARELATNPARLESMIHRGLIRTVKIGKRRMVPASEVRRLKKLVGRPHAKRRGSARAAKRRTS